MSAIALLNFLKLKNASLIYISDEPPDDTSYLWLDTNTSCLMYFNGSWQIVDTGSSSGTESNVIISVNPPSDITKLWFDTTTHKLKYYDTVWKTIDAETILGITIDNNASSGSLWTSDKITNELNNKANVNHNHSVSDLTDYVPGIQRVSSENPTN